MTRLGVNAPTMRSTIIIASVASAMYTCSVA